MKKYFLIAAMALVCLSTLAFFGMGDGGDAGAAAATAAVAEETPVSETGPELIKVNLIQFALDNPIGPDEQVALAEVARSENASTNFVQAVPGAVMNMHYHADRDEIVYVIKGEAVMNVAGEEYIIGPGDLMYLPATILHDLRITGNETFEGISTFVPAFDGKDRIYV